MRLFSIIISTCIFFILSLPGAWATENQIIICGTGDSQELLRHLATEFSAQHPDIAVLVPDSIGSSGGVKSTAMGKCDLGRVARPLKEREMKHGLTYQVFAYSPVVFFTHANVSGVNNLTAIQASSIFSGITTNWKDLGGTAGQIYVAHREKGDSSRKIIEKHIPAFSTLTHQAGITIYSTQEIVDTVASHPNTIGYTALSAIKNNAMVKALSFSGVKAGEGKISESYKLLAPFGLVWRDNPTAASKKFLNFIASPASRKIITDYGAIPAVARQVK